MHIATSCVGAIPYRSGLRTLDKLGLADKVVARSTPAEWRILAHDKHATVDYARSIGVDLWSEDPVHLGTLATMSPKDGKMPSAISFTSVCAQWSLAA